VASKKTRSKPTPKRQGPGAGITLDEAQTIVGGSPADPSRNALAAAMASGNPDLVYATRVALGLAPAARPPAAEE
jgi:hypothetical protein